MIAKIFTIAFAPAAFCLRMQRPHNEQNALMKFGKIDINKFEILPTVGDGNCFFYALLARYNEQTATLEFGNGDDDVKKRITSFVRSEVAKMVEKCDHFQGVDDKLGPLQSCKINKGDPEIQRIGGGSQALHITAASVVAYVLGLNVTLYVDSFEEINIKHYVNLSYGGKTERMIHIYLSSSKGHYSRMITKDDANGQKFTQLGQTCLKAKGDLDEEKNHLFIAENWQPEKVAVAQEKHAEAKEYYKESRQALIAAYKKLDDVVFRHCLPVDEVEFVMEWQNRFERKAEIREKPQDSVKSAEEKLAKLVKKRKDALKAYEAYMQDMADMQKMKNLYEDFEAAEKEEREYKAQIFKQTKEKEALQKTLLEEDRKMQDLKSQWKTCKERLDELQKLLVLQQEVLDALKN